VRVAGGPTNPNAHFPANVAAHPPDAAVWEPNTVTEVESGAHCLTHRCLTVRAGGTWTAPGGVHRPKR
jgi:hypothetical protein